MHRYRLAVALLVLCIPLVGAADSDPVRTKGGMVVSASAIASQVGADILDQGGSAVDAAVATAFALAVTYPAAGNIGGGGFLLYRSQNGAADAYDFRETAPSASNPHMFLRDGKYDTLAHHKGHGAVGVPGTVAGLYLAWKERGKLPWKRLVEPAVRLAKRGFVVDDALSRSLRSALKEMRPYASSLSQFSRNGVPYEPGDILKQADLGVTLERIRDHGPAGFYEGETAEAIVREMEANRGLITRDDLKNYRSVRREPIRGTYRGHEIISMPPPSSGGICLVEMLNVLSGYNVSKMGYGSSSGVHLMAETARRAFADRAAHLGDPEFNRSMPVDRLTSKGYADEVRKSIKTDRASVSSPTTFSWPAESAETTHLSVVDTHRNAVSLTYTLEQGYGSHIVVPGAGFLLNNEMGDFNAAPGMTTETGLVGTPPNLAQAGKRMLSSMSPTIITKDGALFMVTGSPGGRTIINTVLQTIVNVIDYGMNAQEAVDAGRFHHQWLPDRIDFERFALSPDTISALQAKGHRLREVRGQGLAEVIVVRGETLEGGVDRRDGGGGAAVSR